jgi:hypothetical protein
LINLGQRDEPRVLSLEIAFDASNNSYLSSIDELFTIIRDAIKVKKFIAGLCWIRFAGPSDAYLAMQQTNRTCHIEFDLLKYADSTWDLLNKIAMTTVAFGGRLHWGLNATQFCSSAYPNQQKWKLVWTALTNNGTVLTFNNDFSKRCGLTP